VPVYSYIGINERGKKTSGIVDAENERAARAKLRKMNVYPTSVSITGATAPKAKISLGMEIDFGRFFQRVKIQDTAVMTRQFSTLVSSGIPLVDALVALEAQTANVKLKTAIAAIREGVMEGAKLSEAMKGYPKIFTDLYINMVNAGENSGALDIVLERLADFLEKQADLRRRVVGAMVYPVVMSVVGVILLVVLMVVVIPQMTDILNSFGIELPLPTRIMITLSNVARSAWMILVLGMLAGGIYTIRRYIKTEKGREWYDARILKIPIFGNLSRMVSISRFTRTLATLLSSGVPLLSAMDIVRNIVDNVVLKKALEETKNAVKEGESIAGPLQKSGQIPPMVTHMIATGEKTGQLEKMLSSIANTYDNQINAMVSSMMSILEPVMLVIMGGIIFAVVISVMLPITKFMSEAGNL